ncbi:MAG: D-ribulokinase [Nocardioidaceae bacterium]|jgi:sugar (pentulose or hexulose) kinase|nr:D-ribulokinase [Nocardioidaceae bacterium]
MTPPAGSGDDAWLGVDVGTQSVRAVTVTRTGSVLGAGARALAGRRDGPRHEQDPDSWWDAVAGATTEALLGVRGETLRGVAVDATSGTVVLTDAHGRPLSPGLMYDDTRAAGYVDRVNEAGAQVWAELGYARMQPSWALPKLLWLLDEYSAAVRGGARLAHQSDVVNRHLVGNEVPTDLSNALKTGAHLIDEKWPTDVLEGLAVPADVLPALVRPGTCIGTVSASAAAATRIPQGTPVVAGMTDGCAAQLGAGVVVPGSWNSVLGTTLVLKGVTEQLVRDPLGVVYSHKAPDGHWLPGGASNIGAGVIARDFAGRDLAELDRLAARRQPARAIAYPLASTGERFPFVAADAEAFTLGASPDDVDRYASILQGVGYIERLCFDYLDLIGADVSGEVRFTGGGSRSRYWSQLRADILGRPVTLPDNAEPALGMALLAAAHDSERIDVIAADMVHVRETIEPARASAGRYDEAYLHLVDELESRGWLQPVAATHARTRTRR